MVSSSVLYLLKIWWIKLLLLYIVKEKSHSGIFFIKILTLLPGGKSLIVRIKHIICNYFFFFFSGSTLSINNIPSRWSISCWIMIALKSLYFCFCFFPLVSVNSIWIPLCLLTIPVQFGNEIHASSQRIVSFDLFTMVGLIMTVVQRNLSFLGFFSRWLVAMTLMFSPTCGAAKPTHLFSYIATNNLSQNSNNSSLISSISSEVCLSMGLFIPVCIFLNGYFIIFSLIY